MARNHGHGKTFRAISVWQLYGRKADGQISGQGRDVNVLHRFALELRLICSCRAVASPLYHWCAGGAFIVWQSDEAANQAGYCSANRRAAAAKRRFYCWLLAGFGARMVIYCSVIRMDFYVTHCDSGQISSFDPEMVLETA